jgi:hypothetical protein
MLSQEPNNNKASPTSYQELKGSSDTRQQLAKVELNDGNYLYARLVVSFKFLSFDRVNNDAFKKNCLKVTL